ncbi:acetylcholinesterase-like [Mercenaria mercenaria]|uniref:acetylcholinesterase-like n=1 Tax=Mercenaria mercenaria TaxID=6596 RepID=UPI00234F19EF|nr:acetylcholinesterase-like [Mercenaria mercenaria]
MKLLQLIVVNTFLFISIITNTCLGEKEDIEFKTGKGILIGQFEPVVFDGVENYVTRFLGIPYAKPPVRERRFSRPEPYGDFKVPYNATYHRPPCIQAYGYRYLRNIRKSEDCLYLNIYIPGNLRVPVSKRYPVMLYIHGGGFFAGGAEVYSGNILSSFNDVIVVTINYRLTVFGFLSTGEDSSGNYGLWDMKLAIQWVHDNIHEFSGDATKVTLFGNSAGGAAVQYQAINPANKGLFQRIISQSGSCFAYWAIQNNPAQNFESFISDVGCKRSEHSDIMHCLRSKDMELIKEKADRYVYKFVPSVDKDFLLEDPVTLSQGQRDKGKTAMNFFSGLDLLSGVASYDGVFAWLHWDLQNGLSSSSFNKSVHRLLNRALGRKYKRIPSILIESVMHQYTDWFRKYDDLVRAEKMIELESDITFFVPAIQVSNAHSKSQITVDSNNSYFYVFTPKPDFAPKPDWLKGATHFMEMPYVLGLAKELIVQLSEDYLVPEPFTVSERDIELSKLMMRIWTNFAKTGDPNLMTSDSHEYFPSWPPYTGDKQMYLELSYNTTSDSVKDHFASSSVAYWENIFPLLMECGASSGSNSEFLASKLWLIILIMVSFYFSKISS